MTLTLAPETEARLLAVAMERNIAPEAVIEALLDTAYVAASAPVPSIIQDTAEQARLRAVMFDVIAEAQALDPIPRRDNPNQSPDEQLYGEIVTEKYRRQGFNLQ